MTSRSIFTPRRPRSVIQSSAKSCVCLFSLSSWVVAAVVLGLGPPGWRIFLSVSLLWRVFQQVARRGGSDNSGRQRERTEREERRGGTRASRRHGSSRRLPCPSPGQSRHLRWPVVRSPRLTHCVSRPSLCVWRPCRGRDSRNDAPSVANSVSADLSTRPSDLLSPQFLDTQAEIVKRSE